MRTLPLITRADEKRETRVLTFPYSRAPSAVSHSLPFPFLPQRPRRTSFLTLARLSFHGFRLPGWQAKYACINMMLPPRGCLSPFLRTSLPAGVLIDLI